MKQLIVYFLLVSGLFAAEASYEASIMINQEPEAVIKYMKENRKEIYDFSGVKLLENNGNIVKLGVDTLIDDFVFEIQIHDLNETSFQADLLKVYEGGLLKYKSVVTATKVSAEGEPVETELKISTEAKIKSGIPDMFVRGNLKRKIHATLKGIKLNLDGVKGKINKANPKKYRLR